MVVLWHFGLNPCCSGRCSSTVLLQMTKVPMYLVLILVVVEDVLVQARFSTFDFTISGLNPCCSGRCSSTELYKTKLIINKLKNFTKQIFTFLNRKLTIS